MDLKRVVELGACGEVRGVYEREGWGTLEHVGEVVERLRRERERG